MISNYHTARKQGERYHYIVLNLYCFGVQHLQSIYIIGPRWLTAVPERRGQRGLSPPLPSHRGGIAPAALLSVDIFKMPPGANFFKLDQLIRIWGTKSS